MYFCKVYLTLSCNNMHLLSYFTSTRSVLVINPFPSLSKTLKASLTCFITWHPLNLCFLSVSITICISICKKSNTEELILGSEAYLLLNIRIFEFPEEKEKLLISSFVPTILFGTHFIVISHTNSLKLMSPLPSWMNVTKQGFLNTLNEWQKPGL